MFLNLFSMLASHFSGNYGHVSFPQKEIDVTAVDGVREASCVHLFDITITKRLIVLLN